MYTGMYTCITSMMYIVSIFIAVINTLLNNHEKVNTSLAFIESQIFFYQFFFPRKNLSVTSRTNSYNGCIYGLIIMTWKTGQ